MVTLSDKEDAPLIREHLQKTVSVNGVSDSVNIIGISWGYISPQLLELPPQDYIIASDCFYDTKGTCIYMYYVYICLISFSCGLGVLFL